MDIIWDNSHVLHIFWALIMTGGVLYMIGLIVDMLIAYFKMLRIKRKIIKIAKERWFSLTLDEMYAKLNAGIEIKPSKYLK
tara:strand:+ start:3047 stop:3289 length:243 start_codon:yes stop_codon:yes gene_type:complete